MSESVVISKELRDRLHQSCIAMRMRDAADSLRSAPETVSLEGVDRWDPIKEDGGATYDKHPTGALILFSDACRLVAPVQSGGVERISELEIKNIIQGMLARFVDLDVGIAIKEYVLAHLTTTQSAPSVPSDYVSVPVGLVKDLTIVCSKAEDDDAYAMEKALEKILAERMGTKP